MSVFGDIRIKKENNLKRIDLLDRLELENVSYKGKETLKSTRAENTQYFHLDQNRQQNAIPEYLYYRQSLKTIISKEK